MTRKLATVDVEVLFVRYFESKNVLNPPSVIDESKMILLATIGSCNIKTNGAVMILVVIKSSEYARELGNG